MRKIKFHKIIGFIMVWVLLLGTVLVPKTDSKAATQTLLNTYGALLGHSGTCINLSQLQDSSTLSHVKSQYNSITLENEMKPDALLGRSPSLITQSTAKSLGYYVPSSCTETYVPKINFDTIDKVLKICYERNWRRAIH